ncbi:MAG TPA: hypothetical protein PLQ93_02100 [Bacteroidia bacterium]|nr:hypothetical protein [Bacteroidia bacterium]
MKRNTPVLLIILVALAGLAVYFYYSGSRMSTVSKNDRAFKLTDTAAITRIFLADKEGNSASVERKADGWYVGGKFRCRSEAILNILEAIRLVEVKMPVPRQARENVLRFMSSNAVKVEIYKGNEKIKQYYVGHEPSDSEGSYMLLTKPGSEENFSDPYICIIPGFRGFLQPRFITRENEWRDRLVINFTPPELKSIQVEQIGAQPDSSFEISFINSSSFKLKTLGGKELNFDMARMRQYLIYFQNISYEVLLSGKEKKLQDSLLRAGAFASIRIQTLNKGEKRFYFYRKAFGGEVNPELGTVFRYDPDRCYMNFDQGREWALVQYFVFGKLLITPSYFRPANSVKK